MALVRFPHILTSLNPAGNRLKATSPSKTDTTAVVEFFSVNYIANCEFSVGFVELN